MAVPNCSANAVIIYIVSWLSFYLNAQYFRSTATQGSLNFFHQPIQALRLALYWPSIYQHWVIGGHNCAQYVPIFYSSTHLLSLHPPSRAFLLSVLRELSSRPLLDCQPASLIIIGACYSTIAIPKLPNLPNFTVAS